MAIVGEAQVAIRADGTGFDAQVRRILAGSSGSFRQAGDEAGASWMGGFSNRMRGANGESMLNPVLTSMHRAVGRAGNEHGDTYGSNFSRGVGSSNIGGNVERELRNVERAAGGSGGRAGNNFSQRLASGLGEGKSVASLRALADGFTQLWSKAAVGQTVIGGLVPTISSLVGGIYSLGTAAVSAAGSLGALGPVIGTMIQAGGTLAIAFQGVKNAITAGMKTVAPSAAPARKAIKAVQTDTVNAQRAIADARQRVADVTIANAKKITDANRQVHNAEQDLLDSQRDLAAAQRDLTAARKDAREELQQLAFTTEEAALAEQRAQLNLEDAFAELQKVQNLPADNRTRREAELSFKEAELNYREAKDRASDTADAQVEAAKKGIEGTKAYTSAQKDVIGAQQDVSDAEEKLANERRQRSEVAADNARDLAKAQQNVQRQMQDLSRIQAENTRRAQEAAAANAASSASATTAANAYGTAMDKLSDSAQAFVRRIIELQPRLNAFKKAVQEPFFDKFNGVLNDLVGLMENTLQPALVVTSGILGTMAQQFSGALIRNSARFAEILQINNDILTIFTEKTSTGQSAIGNLVTIIGRLYVAFAPLAKQFATFISNLTAMAVKATEGADGASRLADFAERAGRRMGMFADIIGSIAKILMGLSRAAGPAADALLQYFVDSFNGIEAMVGANQESLAKFFENSNKNLMPLLDLIGKLALALLQVGQNVDMGGVFKTLEGAIEPITQILQAGSEAAPALAELAVSVLKLIASFAESGSLTTFFDTLNFIVGKVQAFIDLPFVKSVLGFVAPIMGVVSALSLVWAGIKKVKDILVGKAINASEMFGKPGAAYARGVERGQAYGAGFRAGAQRGIGPVPIVPAGGAGGRGVDRNPVNAAVPVVPVAPRRAAPGGPVGGGAVPRRAAPDIDAAPVEKSAGRMTRALGGVGRVFSGLLGMLPLIMTAVSLLLPIFQNLYEKNEGFRKSVDSLIGVFAKVAGTVMTALAPVLDTLMGLFTNLVETLVPVVTQVVGAVASVFQSLAPIIVDVIGVFVSIFQTIAPIIMQVISLVVPIIKILADQFLSVLIPVIKLVIQIFGGVLQAILPPLIEVVRVVAGALMPIFQALMPVVKELGSLFIFVVVTIAGMIKQLLPVIMLLINTIISTFLQLIPIILPIVMQLVQLFISVLIPAIQQLLPVFTLVVTSIMSIVSELLPVLIPVFTQIINIIVGLLPVIMPIILQIVNLFIAVLVPAIEFLIPVITFMVQVFSAAIRFLLPIVTQIIVMLVTLFVKILIPAIMAIVPIVQFMVNVMMNSIRTAFLFVQWIWGNVLRPVLDAIRAAINRVRDNVAAFRTSFEDSIRKAFQYFRDAYNRYLVPIFDAFEKAMGKLQEWAQAARDGMGTAFSGLVDKIKGPIKDVINGVNNWLIKPLNAVVGVFSDKLKIPLISVKGLAEGGPVEGRGGPKADNQLRRLSVGEYVIKTSSAQKVGKPFLDAVNKGYNPMAAIGGLFSDVTGTIKKGWNEVSGATSNVAKLLKETVTKRIGDVYTKTIEPNLSKVADANGYFGKFAAAMLSRLKLAVVEWAKKVDKNASSKVVTESITAADGGRYGAPKAGRYGGRNFSAAQLKNAATIASVAKSMGLGERGALIGIMTAIVESGLVNVNYGDRDSLGLFQQRGPWGSAKNRTTPSWAATAFYKALKRLKNWKSLPMGVAAQRVQISAFPGRYALQEDVARAILKAMGTAAPSGAGAILGSGKGSVIWPTTSKALSPNYGGHSGLDVRVSYKPVWGSSAGRVAYTGWGKGYGHAMMIASMGIVQIYGHLSKVTKNIGDAIKKGERFGTTGNTGHSTGPHLHLEVADSVAARGRSSNRNKTIRWYESHGVNVMAAGGTVLPTAGGVLSLLAEAGRPERVEPLDREGMSNRDRAVIRSVVEQLTNNTTVNNLGGAGPVTVRVYIGDTELRDIVHFEIDENNSTVSNMLRAGRRRG